MPKEMASDPTHTQEASHKLHSYGSEPWMPESLNVNRCDDLPLQPHQQKEKSYNPRDRTSKCWDAIENVYHEDIFPIFLVIYAADEKHKSSNCLSNSHEGV